MATAMIISREELFCKENTLLLEEDLEDFPINQAQPKSQFPVSVGLQGWFKQYGGIEN